MNEELENEYIKLQDDIVFYFENNPDEYDAVWVKDILVFIKKDNKKGEEK